MKYYFPELDHYFLKYWWYNKDIYNVDIIYPEIELKDSIIKPDNFFALLFDNTYNEDHYVFTFSEIELTSFSNMIRERLKSSGASLICYISDINSELDYFDIQNEVEDLLNLLLQYRLTETCDLSSIDYESLQKKLSKMIYQYLDLMINDNTTYFDNNVFSDPDDILESMYESYLLNEAHKKIKNLKFLSESITTILRPERYKVVINKEIENDKMVRIDDIPYNEIDFFVFRNGDLLDKNAFNLINDTTGYTISWIDKDTEFKENDILIADYYVRVGQ